MSSRWARLAELWRHFHRRDTHPAAQFLKYAISGVCATVTDVVIFYSLSWFVFRALAPSDPLVQLFGLTVAPLEDDLRLRHFRINSYLAFMCSNLMAYLLNIFWVFTRGRHRWYVELALFYAVSGISILIGTELGGLLIGFCGLSTTSSYVAKAGASLLINYVCRRFIIFKG